VLLQWLFQTGIISTLVRDLGRHAELAQESLDASVKYEAISHLQQCQASLKSLESLIEAGKLPDAVQAHVDMDSWFEQAPEPLSRTDVMLDAKVRQTLVGYYFFTKVFRIAEVSSCESTD
jgi:protein transport protein DSL1/ZW10